MFYCNIYILSYTRCRKSQTCLLYFPESKLSCKSSWFASTVANVEDIIPLLQRSFPLLLKQSMSVSRYYKKSPAKSPHRKTDKKNKSSPILGHCTKRHQTITDGTTITTKLFKHSKHDLAGNPTHIAARLKKIQKNYLF